MYCPGSVDRSARRTVCWPLRVFVPSNAADDSIDPTRAGAFRFQAYKVGLHIAYDGRNRHLVAGVAPRSGVGNPVNVGTGNSQRDGNEPYGAQQTTAKEEVCRGYIHTRNYVPGRQQCRGVDGLYPPLSGRVRKSLG